MSRPISDYAMLSDCHTAALVSLDGAIEWLCLPRFDSPSLFGRLLDEDAGHWSLRPRGVTSAELTDSRGLVLRYRPRDGATDGVSGGEGSFLLCTYWLAECLAKAGEIEVAREVFERATAHANDVGLLAEEVESETGELLGNFPQAMSHIGVVNAAWAIAEQEAEAGQGATAQSE
jgi:GH15 family glucan-1,4-alpha-glucosidase